MYKVRSLDILSLQCKFDNFILFLCMKISNSRYANIPIRIKLCASIIVITTKYSYLRSHRGLLNSFLPASLQDQVK